MGANSHTFLKNSVTNSNRVCYTVATGGSRGQAPQEQEGSEMFDYRDIKDQVILSLDDEADFDVDGIMDDLRAHSHSLDEEISSIDDVDPDVYWDIVAKNAVER